MKASEAVPLSRRSVDSIPHKMKSRHPRRGIASEASMTRKTSGLKTVCAWCGAVMADGEEPVSHGCCLDCLKRDYPEVFEKLRKIDESERRMDERRESEA